MSLTGLGRKIGLPHPYTRMSQYEASERTPKEPTLVAMAQALEVSSATLTSCVGTTVVDLMESILWIEEFEGVEVVRACIQEWVQMRAMYDSVPARIAQSMSRRHTYTPPVTRMPSASGTPWEPAKTSTSFRQYTTSRPNTAPGSTRPR